MRRYTYIESKEAIPAWPLNIDFAANAARFPAHVCALIDADCMHDTSLRAIINRCKSKASFEANVPPRDSTKDSMHFALVFFVFYCITAQSSRSVCPARTMDGT